MQGKGEGAEREVGRFAINTMFGFGFFDLAARRAGLEQQRQTALQAVDADSLQIYRELRSAKRGQVVAPMVDNMCKVCGTTQNLTIAKQVRTGQGLVYCIGCGRILVFS